MYEKDVYKIQTKFKNYQILEENRHHKTMVQQMVFMLIKIMDLLLLGSYTRFSCNLIK